MSERAVQVYTIRGRVQRVGFRWWARGVARSLGLAGTVRNAPDGSVRVVAAGDVERLGSFEAALRRGPPGARVDSVDVRSESSALDHASFEISPL